MWIEHLYDFVKDSWTGFDNPSMCYVLDHQASDWWHFLLANGLHLHSASKTIDRFFWSLGHSALDHCGRSHSLHTDWILTGLVPASFCDCSIKGVRVEHGHTSRKFANVGIPSGIQSASWATVCFVETRLLKLLRSQSSGSSRQYWFWGLFRRLVQIWNPFAQSGHSCHPAR